jgi:hypothetical protein
MRSANDGIDPSEPGAGAGAGAEVDAGAGAGAAAGACLPAREWRVARVGTRNSTSSSALARGVFPDSACSKLESNFERSSARLCPVRVVGGATTGGGSGAAPGRDGTLGAGAFVSVHLVHANALRAAQR